MIRSTICTLLCLFTCLVSTVEAQVFPNAFWNKGTQTRSSCPGGVCPTSAYPATSFSSSSPGHWSYPGDIDSHLEGQAHGYSTAGMTHQQKLDLHDALHEGRAPVVRAAPIRNAVIGYPAVSSTTQSYDSSGTRVFNGGSCGTATTFSTQAAPAAALPPAEPFGAVSSSNREFRKVLMQAASEARRSGDISIAEYFKLSLATRVPGVLEKIQAATQEAAAEQGLANSVGAVDWEKLLQFIKDFLPILLELISLFADSTPTTVINALPYVDTTPISFFSAA